MYNHFTKLVFSGIFIFSLLCVVPCAFGQESWSMDTLKLEKTFAQRQQDWRNQQLVYQIFVDRFARSQDTPKSELLLPPRQWREWHEKPAVGRPLDEFGCWSHELEFWGGDLKGVASRLSYLKELGVNTIYLNPIFSAFTNHKYDTLDYFQIDPLFGTWEDLKELAEAAHRQQMKIVLDGVFNHMGRRAPWFQEALENPVSPYRAFFNFGPQFPLGYRAWANVKNLPELNFENPAVQEKIFSGKDSAVHRYLQIVDGWRLDVAFELGPEFLQKITQAAHESKPGSLVVGEIWSYPDGWLKAMDGVMNYYQRQVILDVVGGQLCPVQATRFIDKMVQDAGIESILKCWTILSSHDTARLKELVPDPKLRKLALVLQFTLPGAPVVYYGEELGMTGKDDPLNRGPMEWQLLQPHNEEYGFYQKLIAFRNAHPAVQYGDFVALDTKTLMAFMRKTHLVRDTVVVVVNPTNQPVAESVSVPEYRLMNWAKVEDWSKEKQFVVFCGIIKVEVPAKSCYILTPLIEETGGYSPYKRIK